LIEQDSIQLARQPAVRKQSQESADGNRGMTFAWHAGLVPRHPAVALVTSLTLSKDSRQVWPGADPPSHPAGAYASRARARVAVRPLGELADGDTEAIRRCSAVDHDSEDGVRP
jgi:hypothetical protein